MSNSDAQEISAGASAFVSDSGIGISTSSSDSDLLDLSEDETMEG